MVMAGFERDGVFDQMVPSPALVAALERVAGPDGRCTGLTDNAVAGVIGGWAAIAAWAEARMQDAMVALVRRREIPGCEIGPEGIPAVWDDSVTEEIALELAISRQSAARLISQSFTQTVRLPGTAAEQRAGHVTGWKAKIVADATACLDDDKAREAEALALGWAGGSFAGKTPAQIRKLIERAAVQVDPGLAEKQREGATAAARLSFYRESSGTTGLQVTGLDPQAGIEAEQAVEDRAQEYKAAGLEGGIDRLRVQAMTDRLTGRNPLVGDGDPQARPAFPARVHLTVPELIVPVLSMLAAGDIPGELNGRVIDPALVRELARAAAAAGNGSDWHLTVTDENGWAVKHGCEGRKPTAKHPGTGEMVTVAGRAFPLHQIPVTSCTHQYEEPRHDPSPLLRHLVNVRDRECVQPTCTRPAAMCDYEHAIEYGKGGRTCACNGSPKCERDHGIKHRTNWTAIQTAPGFHEWRTPSGRIYRTEPARYPA
jgi:hypothetical protein